MKYLSLGRKLKQSGKRDQQCCSLYCIMSIVKYFFAKLGKSNHDPAPSLSIFFFILCCLFIFDTSNVTHAQPRHWYFL